MMGSLHNLTRDFSECPTIHFKVFTQMLTNNEVISLWFLSTEVAQDMV